jgi:hypothetical protein
VKIVGFCTPHFKWSECESHETPPVPVPEALRENCRATCVELERIRAACLCKGLTVTRLYSTPAHNAAVGGAPGSWHLKALAADIVPPEGMTARMLFQRVRQVPVLTPASRIRYVKFYPVDGHVHLDLRPGETVITEVETT